MLKWGYMKILEVKDLKTYFYLPGKIIKAVDGISFELQKNEVLAIAGESGAGKTVTSKSILNLFSRGNGKIVGGSVKYKNVDLTKAGEDELRKIRGRKIALIYQEPRVSLNPSFTVRSHLRRALAKANNSKRVNDAQIEAVLEKYDFMELEKVLDNYPFQLSGGLAQRVAILLALIFQPEILIADEPTSSLDTTTQYYLLEHLFSLRKEGELSTIIITHDLGVAARYSSKMLVVYKGKSFEFGETKRMFKMPYHPYTAILIKSAKSIFEDNELIINNHLVDLNYPKKNQEEKGGCVFAEKCNWQREKCKSEKPEYKEISDKEYSLCHFSSDDGFLKEIKEFLSG